MKKKTLANRLIFANGKVIEGRALTTYWNNRYFSRQNKEDKFYKAWLSREKNNETEENICARFEIAPSYLNSVIARCGDRNTKGIFDTINSLVKNTITDIKNGVEEKILFLRDEQFRIQGLIDEGINFLTIEIKTGTGRNSTGETSKDIPIKQYQKELHDEIIDTYLKIVESIKPFTPREIILTEPSKISAEQASHNAARLELLKTERAAILADAQEIISN